MNYHNKMVCDYDPAMAATSTYGKYRPSFYEIYTCTSCIDLSATANTDIGMPLIRR